jgi:membrane fusion protein (multidrug efflux system)
MRCRRTMTRIMIMALVLLSGWTGCQKKANDENDPKKEAETLIPVEVAEVTQGNISAHYSSTANLETEAETDVVAKVGGVVQKLLVEEGDVVRAGQVLAKLDDEKLKFQYDQAKASLEKLENEYRRSEELYEKQLISTETYQKAKYDLEVQKAAFRLVELDLEYTAIRTPISGVVAERLIKVGNMIALHQPVFRITGMDTLLAVIHVPERHLSKLRVGQNALLRVDAINGGVFHGSIKRISPVVDPASGTVKVTVEIMDKTRQLKPGMFARLQVVYDVHENVLLIPKDALLAEDQSSSVFIVQDSLVFRKEVQTGYVNTSHIEVLTGVELGDTVVTIGKGSLKDSARVDMVNLRAAGSDIDSMGQGQTIIE